MKRLRRSLLVVIFVLCCVLPLYLVGRLFGLFSSASSKSAEVSSLFSEALSIQRTNSTITIEHAPDLVPIAQRDFLAVFWVNFKKLPAENSRLVLFSKYEGDPPRVKGYAVGVRRDDNSMRPVVFYGDGTSRSKWYDFPDYSFAPGVWTCFALTVEKGRFVGLHIGQRAETGAPITRSLGGYDIGSSLADLGAAPIVMGAFPGRDFRGQLGPVFIVSPFKQNSQKFATDFDNYLRRPLKITETFGAEGLQLAILDGKSDSSPHQHVIAASF